MFYPESGFFQDYERFYSRRFQIELPFIFAVDENTTQKPQEMVLYFYQQLYGTKAVDQLGFSEKETSFAASLLEKHSAAEVKGFIDFGIMEGKKTNFDIKTLGGLKKYYAPYTKGLAARGQAMQHEAKEQTKKDEDRRLAAYESYREKELARIRATLSKADVATLENSVRQELESLHPGSKSFSGWVRQRGDRFLMEKHGMLSFDERQRRCG